MTGKARKGRSTRPGVGGTAGGSRPRPRRGQAKREDPRRLALDAMVRIEEGGYANLVLPAMLARSDLDQRDRAFVTELVYGSTRMRRACDWLVARFLDRPMVALDPRARNTLRLGAHQLTFMGTPAHAALSATVAAAPARARGLVNAVLRRVAASLPPPWPDDPTRLSYPDWIVHLLVADLGPGPALAALEEMNRPATVSVRSDGYVQDLASQWVVEVVGARPGDRVADLCAAPGGKATALAQAGATVTAVDVRPPRSGLLIANVARLGVADRVLPLVADARWPPLRPRGFDRVLVDAPCSGLGVLRRRPDARWRIQAQDVPALAVLQREILGAALKLAKPGGTLVYSVCTLSAAETTEIDEWLTEVHPELRTLPGPGEPWERVGRGARLLPQSTGTDGMYVLLGILAS